MSVIGKNLFHCWAIQFACKYAIAQALTVQKLKKDEVYSCFSQGECFRKHCTARSIQRLPIVIISSAVDLRPNPKVVSSRSEVK